MSSWQELRVTLQSHWLKQLYREYRDICYQYGVKLPGAAIRLSCHANVWGQWDHHTKTITINVKLIEQYSWEQVISVLKHEMAHQYVSEIDRVDEAHGVHFQRACEKLGVEAWARKASFSLDQRPSTDWRHTPLNSQQKRMHEKVKKLLALAESCNEHEAYAAMKKVKELVDAYHLDMHQDGILDEYVTLVINHKKRRIEAFQSMIAAILNRHFFVRVIFSSLYDAQKNITYKTIEILGQKEHVLLGEYVYWFLYHQIKLMWQNYQATTDQKGVHARNSFYMGILSGFDDKLALEKTKDQDPSYQATTKKLLVVADRQLNKYVSLKFPRLQTRSWGGRRYDAETFADGQEQGRQLTLKDGLNSSCETVKLLR